MRVVVTGIGMVTPLGADREASWRRIAAGERACRWLDAGEGLAGAPAALDVDLEATAPAVSVALALRAAREALADARLEPADLERERVGCVIGTSKGDMRSAAAACAGGNRSALESRRGSAAGGGRRHLIPERGGRGGENQGSGADRSGRRSEAGGSLLPWMPDAAAAAVAAEFDLRGAALCPVAACATGLAAILRGADLIREGVCDVVLAGSSDASLTPAVLASFRRMGVLARGFDDPAVACRPFDRRRNGFLVGEGAAILVLERGTPERAELAYGELLACGALGDVSGLTVLDAGGEALARLIAQVFRRAGLSGEELGYINLHGTATAANDLCETRAIRRALGSAADGVPGSSLKGGLGHLLGAAGSVETACTLLAMRDGILPPTVNLDEPAEGCDLDYVPREARRAAIGHALKLSLGFGGHLMAAAFRRGDRPPLSGAATQTTD